MWSTLVKGQGFWLPPDVKYRQVYLCLWEMPDGRYVGNSDGEFMCAESFHMNDPVIEQKMRDAAVAYGYPEGNPVWMPGRKVSAMESDDQMERLLNGKIPDEREEELIAIEEEWVRKQSE